MKMRKYLLISTAVFFLFIALTGCRAGKKQSKAVDAEKNGQPLSEKTLSPTPPVQDGEDRIELKPAPGNTASFPAKAKISSGGEKTIFNLISDMGADFITPDDFEIGPLLVHNSPEKSAEGETGQEESYALFIAKFFKELEKGIIAAEMIDRDNLQFLKQVFESSILLGQIPDNIRIGEAVRIPSSVSSAGRGNSEIIRLNLRMFKGKNRTEGEVFLLEKEGSFRISSFNGDLSKLDIDYKEEEGKFEPEIYRF